MTGDAFSRAFRRFVRENITSVEQLRILLLLSERPERASSAELLSAELASSPHSVGLRLTALLRRKLIAHTENGEFAYRPDPSHDTLVAELRDQFALRPVSVISLIYAGGLESFSDAFRIGGSEPEDG